MNTVADLYVDKGTDFDAIVEINGVNNRPVSVDNWRFSCTAYMYYNPSVKINIDVTPYERQYGCIHLHIPFCETSKLPNGVWRYDIEMSYQDIPLTFNKRLRVLSGKLIVGDHPTCTW